MSTTTLHLRSTLLFSYRQKPLVINNKMQTSIKMFFKSREPNGDKTDEDNIKVSSSGSKKRTADDQDDKAPTSPKSDNTPTKRQALTPTTSGNSTPSISDTPIPKPVTPIKMTDSKKGTSTSGDLIGLSPAPSPLQDINLVIRQKISSGSTALHPNIGHSWFRALRTEFDKPYFKKLSAFVQSERDTKTVYPPPEKVYTWTHYHPIKDTRVVILGQDPYHGPNQAHGLSFSVQRGIRCPPSLLNIFKELESDIPGFKAPACGELTGWAKQGVLMLNTCLTVNAGQAFSHQNKGWETFTDAVISWISRSLSHKIVFVLWGSPAQKKATLIDKRHKILTSVHPSPLSAHRGFFGSRHFSQANEFLKSQNLPQIDWKAL